jgi:hypothetical protein
MSTEAFLRIEKEWQRVRRAVHRLEIETKRPDGQNVEDIADSELADLRSGRIKSS